MFRFEIHSLEKLILPQIMDVLGDGMRVWDGYGIVQYLAYQHSHWPLVNGLVCYSLAGVVFAENGGLQWTEQWSGVQCELASLYFLHLLWLFDDGIREIDEFEPNNRAMRVHQYVRWLKIPMNDPHMMHVNNNQH